MFDEKEPQDIFSGTERPAALPPTPAPAAPASYTAPPSQVVPPPSMQPVAAYDDHEPRSLGKIVAIAAAILLTLGLVGTAIYVVLFSSQPGPVVIEDSTDTTDDIVDPVDDGQPIADPVDALPDFPEPTTTAPVVEEPVERDSDGDGLTDSAEVTAGTSIVSGDTDNDGLGDREEVQVYGTDPRRADTDGDTYSDGQEVQGGYNPNGPGRLLDIPAPSNP